MKKWSKELKTGVLVVTALVLLIGGINFLKGSSFWGGDDTYYVYFPESGGVGPATSVYVNGVIVGKVLEVQLTGDKDMNKKVIMTFNIQDRNFKISKGSIIQTGNADLLNRGIIITPNEMATSFYKPKTYLQGESAGGMMEDAANLIGTVDHLLSSLSTFWDSTANDELGGILGNLKKSLNSFANVASQMESLMNSEQAKLSKILTNVESITSNLDKSNVKIQEILGNAQKLTDDMVAVDFKETINQAKSTLTKFNTILESTAKGEGTLGKLVADEQLYNELNTTNSRLQSLLEDFEKNPHRYIHFSVFGTKVKGVDLSNSEEKKLKKMLNSEDNK